MLKLKYAQVKKRLRELNMAIFTDKDLQQIFGANKRASQAFLSYNNQKKYLFRLKKGYYCFVGESPHSFIVANKIYTPSYISLASALSYHQIIPETIYAITSITSRKTNEFEVGEKLYIYRSMKKKGFTGYKTYQLNHHGAYVATPEKALADYTYYLYLDGGKFNERMTLKKINKNKLAHYLKLLGQQKLLNFWRSRND